MKLPDVVNSSLYPFLVDKILKLDPEVGQEAADQLLEAGHTAQSAAIQVSL